MHIDGCENDIPFSYQPQMYGRWAAVKHGALFYSYGAESREKHLQNLAAQEPELALAVECCSAMGLYRDCAEIALFREAAGMLDNTSAVRLRIFAPHIAEVLRSSSDRLRKLHFTFIIPVVSAIDAGETDIAVRILQNHIETMVAANLPHS